MSGSQEKSPRFICHPDFADIAPRDVWGKEKNSTPEKEAPSQEQNRHILFRQKIRLESVQKAGLRITADDHYRLYINGVFVAEGPAPSYPQAWYYNALDVTDYLTPGENTFAVHTYYQGLVNRVWVSGDRRQMLWFSLQVGEKEVLVSNETWRCADHTGYTSLGVVGYDTAFGEFYHSNAPEVGFEQPDFDDTGWIRAACYRAAGYRLFPQPTNLLAYETLLPQKTERLPHGIRLDFGQEAVGSLRVKAVGNNGDIVTLRYGEERNPDGSVRYHMRCNCTYEEKWELSGREDILDNYDYKAFRYAELLIPPGVTVKEILFRVRHYPYEEKASYPTGNEKLQAILTLCKNTVKYGTQEVFLDCPTREKGQYLGDLAISGRAQAVLTGKTDLLKKAILDFCHSSFLCPGLMGVAPCGKMQEIADYSLQVPALVTWVYAVDSDISFLKQVEPAMTGLYRYFLAYENKEGLLYGLTEKWNLVDWPEGCRDGYSFDLSRPQKPGLHNVINALWCGFLSAMDEYLSLLGKAPTGKTQKAKKAFIRTFYSSALGLFCDTPEKDHASVHANIFPLLFNIGTENRALTRRLIGSIDQKGLSSMGVYTAYFALAALIRHGERALAEDLATREDAWLSMLCQGATTTFEVWDKEKKWNTSLFHPWAVAPAVVFADIPRIY